MNVLKNNLLIIRVVFFFKDIIRDGVKSVVRNLKGIVSLPIRAWALILRGMRNIVNISGRLFSKNRDSKSVPSECISNMEYLGQTTSMRKY
jgi:hypothetical protein